MKMRKYKIEIEVHLKPVDTDLEYDDFIYRAIEEQLERGEDIMNYKLREITE